jgi:hypothetical protein
LKDIQKKYHGYRFTRSEQTVYNPYSLLKAFDEGALFDYWFHTGSPTYLIKQITSKKYDLEGFFGTVKIKKSALSAFRIGNPKLTPLLYQSGYYTIKDVQGDEVILGFPNEEVRVAFTRDIFLCYFPKAEDTFEDEISYLRSCLKQDDLEGFMLKVSDIFSDLAYDVHQKIEHYEEYYQKIFQAIFLALELDYSAEVHSALGRADGILKVKDRVYAIEYKMAKHADVNQDIDEALKQIEEKDYLGSYKTSNLKRIKFAIIMDSEIRNIKGWRIEICQPNK